MLLVEILELLGGGAARGNALMGREGPCTRLCTVYDCTRYGVQRKSCQVPTLEQTCKGQGGRLGFVWHMYRAVAATPEPSMYFLFQTVLAADP